VFRYLTSYRGYTLAKVGLALAYLWFIGDFFRIHLAFWAGLSLLLPNPAAVVSADDSPWNLLLRAEAFFIGSPVLVWTVFLASPFVAGLFLWGRCKWLQCAVACWLCSSMVAMVAYVGVFASAADVWLNLAFLSYGITTLLCPANKWDEREPGFGWEIWRKNPTLASAFAWLLVVIQFAVYFFAGITKLVAGWDPWVMGFAIQNLAYDSSMHDFARGLRVPYSVSWFFCYVTLFQRLVVPFGFFFMRYRGWAVLILGAMHLGYDMLMQVAIFPLVGIAFLFIVVPPRKLSLPLFCHPSLRQPREVRKLTGLHTPPAPLARVVLAFFALWLILESARIALFEVVPWESPLLLAPTWRMFADGGVEAGRKWRLVLLTSRGQVDGTGEVLESLPHLWRDRFYIDVILHQVEDENFGKQEIPSNSLPERLLSAIEIKHDEPISGARFAIYEGPKRP
jgi:hypothetical protein